MSIRAMSTASSYETQNVVGRGFLLAAPAIALLYTGVLIQLFKIWGISFDPSGASRPENIIFWFVLSGAAIFLVLCNARLIHGAFFKTPAMILLAAYVLFAAASVTWAYHPATALKSVILHVLVVSIILLPLSLRIDIGSPTMRLAGVFGIAVMVNAVYVATTPATVLGHFGIYDHKQLLGLTISLAIILALGNLIRPGTLRRVASVIIIALGFWLLVESSSKGALAILLLAPCLAAIVLSASKVSRASPAIIIAAVPIVFTLLSIDTQDFLSKQAHRFYGDYSITGRIDIWQFIWWQISQTPWLGWGFHSYWFVPNSPHELAPGFVKDMISSHSGYLELRLYTGAIGYGIFMLFLYTSLRGLDRLLRISFAHAWVLTSIALYVILTNLFESLWFMLTPSWLAFLVVFAELNRSVAGTDVGTKVQTSDRGPAIRPHNFPSSRVVGGRSIA